MSVWSYEGILAEANFLGRQVRLAARSGTVRQLIRAQDRYIASAAAKFLAAHRVRKQRAKKSGYATPSERTQLAAAAALAAQIDVSRMCNERVYIEPVRKSDEGYRLTCSYGELAQARQQLIVDLLRWHEHLPHEQTILNGGRDAAIRKIQRNFAAGFRYCAELDIRRCFKSFRTERLSWLLRLPESVVDNVISIRDVMPVPSRICRNDILHHLPDDTETPEQLFQALLGSEWEQARLGLPEGSLLSPVVAELLLAPVVRALNASRLGRVVTYADNFFLSATSEVRLRKMVSAFQDQLLRHPAGPVAVREDFTTTSPSEHFEFLGYRLTPNDGVLSVTWATKHELRARRMRREAYQKLHSDIPHHQKLKALARVEREHTMLTRSFASWPDREAFNDAKLVKLRQALYPRGGPARLG